MIQKITPRPPMKGQVGQPAAHVTADPCLKEKNRIAWGEMIRQARQGSAAALEQCIAYATPFVEGYCNSRFFASQLGKDEIRKDVIAYYAELAERIGVRFRVVYEADGELVSEESLGYERVG